MGAKKGKLGGLGAKKAAAPINFDEVEKKAQEEAAQAKTLELEERKRQEEEQAKLEAEKLAAATSPKTKSPEVLSTSNKPAASAPVNAAAKSKTPQGNTQDLERLGMGFKKLGFGGVPQGSTAPTSRSQYALYSNSRIAFALTCLFHD